MSSWWRNNQDITIDVDDIINQIPTEDLELELKNRKELQKEDIEQFQREERGRSSELETSICIDDYDLVKADEIDISDFNDDQIINYLEHNGYSVFQKTVTCQNNLESVARYLSDVPTWKFKEFLCDIIGMTHLTSKEEIIHGLENKF